MGACFMMIDGMVIYTHHYPTELIIFSYVRLIETFRCLELNFHKKRRRLKPASLLFLWELERKRFTLYVACFYLANPTARVSRITVT